MAIESLRPDFTRRASVRPSLPITLVASGEPAHLLIVGLACAAALLSGLSVTPFGFVICVGLLCATALKLGARISWLPALLLTLPLLACSYCGFEQMGTPLPSSAFGIGASGLW